MAGCVEVDGRIHLLAAVFLVSVRVSLSHPMFRSPHTHTWDTTCARVQPLCAVSCVRRAVLSSDADARWVMHGSVAVCVQPPDRKSRKSGSFSSLEASSSTRFGLPQYDAISQYDIGQTSPIRNSSIRIHDSSSSKIPVTAYRTGLPHTPVRFSLLNLNEASFRQRPARTA
jgi:hypothetical protein